MALETSEGTPPLTPTAQAGGSQFMRPFALGATVYLLGLNALYLLTRGAFYSPDKWSTIYMAILGAYAGGPELQRWWSKTEHPNLESWEERLRKGGPFVTAWLALLAIAGFFRMSDPTRPMPPELQTIALEVVGLFFGTYAFRRYRSSRSAKSTVAGEGAAPHAQRSAADREALVEFLRGKGPATPRVIADAMGFNRRQLGRLLQGLVTEGTLRREGRSTTDPNVLYRLSE